MSPERARSGYLVLDTGILSLRVFADEDGVNVVVRSLEALDRGARSDIGKEVECPAEGQVKRHMSLADCNERLEMWVIISAPLTWGSKRACRTSSV